MKRWLWLLTIGIALPNMAAQAHHSISGVYDSSRPATVEGTVTEFQFVNPHPFVLIAVTDRGGQAQSWKLELDNRWELADVGMTSSTFRPGDRLVVTGSLGRTQPNSLYVRRLERPADGFMYEQAGTRPRVRAGKP